MLSEELNIPIEQRYKRMPENKKIKHHPTLVFKAWRIWQRGNSPLPPRFDELEQYPDDEMSDVLLVDYVINFLAADYRRKHQKKET